MRGDESNLKEGTLMSISAADFRIRIRARRLHPASACLISLSLCLGSAMAADTLSARALLPAASFASGPTSGGQLGAAPINGQTVPFTDKQPIQGFSAVLRQDDSTYLVMSDNGYGAMENSSDFNLRVHTLKPDFKTRAGGSGSLDAKSFFELRDPDHKIPFTLSNQFSDARVLTGADFDIESMQKAPDGTFWFGDEFGPFLIHTDASGKVLTAPVPLPDFDNPGKFIRSPQNPYSEEASAVRIMNAFRNHARAHGGAKVPVFSPYHVQLDDNNPAVDHYARGPVSPTGSGLKPAESGIFNVTSLKNAGYPVVTWTVDEKPRMLELMKLGVNGIISDRPDLLWQAVTEFNADTTGTGGTPRGWLDADGLLIVSKFDAQGHRGGRDLRPENSLPAMEGALDNLMTTLETDFGLSKDSIPIIKHDPEIDTAKCRSLDGPFTAAVLIKDLTAAQIQSTYICDKIIRDSAFQKADTALSPVASAFMGSKGLPTYAMPTVSQLFAFVDAYVAYYKTGAGKDLPTAAKRWKNAERVRFNIETKTNPRAAYAARTFSPEAFADRVYAEIKKANLTDRADVQSFDFRSLKHMQEMHPDIRTVYLFGDFPVYADATNPDSDDGTNMQDENGANTPWMAGCMWPYRVTRMSNPFRQLRSAGFEGMALSWDRTKLYPLLEKPLLAAADTTLLAIHEFDLASGAYTQGKRYYYKLNPSGTNIGDFVMYSPTQGIIIERDPFQGPAAKHKVLYRITLGDSGRPVGKDTLVNLLDIKDPDGISSPVQPGDVATGSVFGFPFETIEDVFVLNDSTVGVLNDNNYPFSVGRHAAAAGAVKPPDDDEFILIRLGTHLVVPAAGIRGDGKSLRSPSGKTGEAGFRILNALGREEVSGNRKSALGIRYRRQTKSSTKAE
jgi:glycerophosphoryl diester phosphodiesterase